MCFGSNHSHWNHESTHCLTAAAAVVVAVAVAVVVAVVVADFVADFAAALRKLWGYTARRACGRHSSRHFSRGFEMHSTFVLVWHSRFGGSDWSKVDTSDLLWSCFFMFGYT